MSRNALISVDSYGWIERFTNGPKAAQYNKVIDAAKPNDIVTSMVVVFEVYKRIKKLKGEEEALLAAAVLSQTVVVPIDQTIALEAADFSLENNLLFSDALVYATARHHKATLYTSVRDLGSLRSVFLI